MRIKLFFLFACLPLGVLFCGFVQNPAFADRYDRTVGAALRTGISYLSGLIPLSLTELLLLSLLPLFLLLLRWGLHPGGQRRALCAVGLVLFWLAALYVTVFSPGRYKPPLGDAIGLSVEEPTSAELSACVDWLSALAEGAPPPPDVRSVDMRLRAGLSAAGERYGLCQNPAARGKRTATAILSRLGYFGLYAFPFCEVTVSDRIPRATYTFTLAHELAHASGYVREEEADLVGFLACLESRDPYLLYAGASGMLGRLLCELYRSAPEAWEAASDKLSGAVRQELYESGEIYERDALATLAGDAPTYGETARLLCALYRIYGKTGT